MLFQLEELRVVYDHYNDKFTTLRQKYPLGTVNEKVSRNERKYQDSKSKFYKQGQEIIELMEDMIN